MFKKRKGARYLKTLSPYDRLLCHVMTKRSDAHVYFLDNADCAPMDAFIARVEKERGIRLSYLDVINAAIVRVYAQKPALNRFVMNGRIYANDEIRISMTVKKSLRDDGVDTVITVPYTGHENVYEVRDKFQDEIRKNKETDSENSADKLMATLVKLPNFLLKRIIGLLKWLDTVNMLPKSLLDSLPFHGSVFVTYLKSIGIRSVYHHIYDFGTIGMFVAIGKEQYMPVVDKKTMEVVGKKMLELKIVVDERICDGLYHAQAMKMFKKLVEHPEQLEECLEEVARDID